MGVTIEGNVNAYLSQRIERVKEAFLQDLQFLGEECVKYVRDRSGKQSWYDQTGNLRSSIGYIVAKDGVIISKSSFEKVNGPHADQALVDGSAEGSSYAESLARKFPQGYALIVVAGMNYAAYVENIDSKDVLASGELFLKNEMKELVKEYKAMNI